MGGLDFPRGSRRTMNIAAFMRVNAPLFLGVFSPSIGGVFLPFLVAVGMVETANSVAEEAVRNDLSSIRWKTMGRY